MLAYAHICGPVNMRCRSTDDNNDVGLKVKVHGF